MTNKTRWTIGILVALVVLVALSLTLSIFTFLSFLSSLRIVFGSIYVLFLPGFVISYIFFPETKEFEENSREKKAIDWIERVALSFALSIAIVPLVVFYLNLIGVKINLFNSFLTILGILVVSLIIMYYRVKNSYDL